MKYEYLFILVQLFYNIWLSLSLFLLYYNLFGFLKHQCKCNLEWEQYIKNKKKVESPLKLRY